MADLTSSPETMPMFVTGAPRILFLSRHVSLRAACDLVTREAVLADRRQAHRALDNEVDVIISGHTHSLLHDNLFGKVVVQAYSASTAFADVDLVLDRAGGDVVKAIPNVITTYADEITPDPEIQGMVAQVEQAVAPLVNRVIGTAGAAITREQNAAGESALGNLIADAQRWKMGTQFAFMNPGGICAGMEAGAVRGELYGIRPAEGR